MNESILLEALKEIKARYENSPWIVAMVDEAIKKWEDSSVKDDWKKWIEDRSFVLNDDLPDVKVILSDQVIELLASYKGSSGKETGMRSKEEILAYFMDCPLYRMSDDLGEYPTKSIALKAMGKYASQFQSVPPYKEEQKHIEENWDEYCEAAAAAPYKEEVDKEAQLKKIEKDASDKYDCLYNICDKRATWSANELLTNVKNAYICGRKEALESKEEAGEETES